MEILKLVHIRYGLKLVDILTRRPWFKPRIQRVKLVHIMPHIHISLGSHTKETHKPQKDKAQIRKVPTERPTETFQLDLVFAKNESESEMMPSIRAHTGWVAATAPKRVIFVPRGDRFFFSDYNCVDGGCFLKKISSSFFLKKKIVKE